MAIASPKTQRVHVNILARLRIFFNEAHPRHDLRYFTLAGIVGVIAAVFATFFRLLIEGFSSAAFGLQGNSNFIESIKGVDTWRVFLVPIAGGTLVAWFTNKFAPESKGHGVPEIIEAVATRRGEIRPRVSIVKMLASTISIGSGFSVGREGPTALIGASIGSFVGQLLKFPVTRMKMVVGCGTAAGIAATFNAPLAGAVFALEIIVGNFNVRQLTPIVSAAMIGTVISHHALGEVHALFAAYQYDLKHPMEIANYAVLGVLAGLVGVIFTKSLYAGEDFTGKINLPFWLKGAIGGAGIGIILSTLPDLSGPATWQVIELPMAGEIDQKAALLLLLILVGKIVATCWSLALGGSGGIFAPSIMMGGCLGASYGFFLHRSFPAYTDSPAGYALVGMGALVAAVTQAPLTAITIVFEMTHNISNVLPLIVSVGIATGIYNHFMDGSIYSLKLMRKGIHLEWGREVGILSSVLVKKIMSPENEIIRADEPVQKVLHHFADSSRSTLPVVDDGGLLMGIISFWDIKNINPDESTLIASDLVQTIEVKEITPNDNLYTAFAAISSGDYEYLPVVEGPNRKLVGRLMRHKVLEHYKNQLTLRGVYEEGMAK